MAAPDYTQLINEACPESTRRYLEKQLHSSFGTAKGTEVTTPLTRLEAAVMELYRASERVCSLEVNLVGYPPKEPGECSPQREPSEDVFGRIEEAADKIMASTANIYGAVARIEKRI